MKLGNQKPNTKVLIHEIGEMRKIAVTVLEHNGDYTKIDHDGKITFKESCEDCFKHYEEILIGKTTIDISGIEAEIEIWRNQEGNLERGIVDEQIICPEGTCLEGYNEEIIISKYNG